MTTYYNITATVAFDQIEADSPQEAAAKAYAEITYKPAPAVPERVLVWEKGESPAGGITYASTAWTFAPDPEAILPPAPVESEVAPTEDRPTEDRPTEG